MESKVFQGQSFSDKTVEATGLIDNVVQFSIENNVSITDPLAIGTLLKYSGAVTKSITSLFNDKNRCATSITQQNHELIVPDEGIGAMIIESTFIVS